MTQPPNVPTVTIMLDRERKLALTLRAMFRIKEATARRKKELASLSNGEVEDQSALLLGPQIWAMLVDEDRGDVTVEDVENRIHMGNMQEITAAMSELEGASTPAGDSDTGKAPAETSEATTQ